MEHKTDRQHSYRWIHELMDEESERDAERPPASADPTFHSIKQGYPKFDKDGAWELMQIYIKERQSTIARRSWYRKIGYATAAAALLLVILTPLLIQVDTGIPTLTGLFRETSLNVKEETSKIKKNNPPDTEQALLVSMGGRELPLDQLEIGRTYLWDELEVSKNSNGDLLLIGRDSTESRREKKKLQELRVPKGRIYSVVLPDGTKVQLNASSKLTFPSYFEKERKVILEGEAYFDVSKDPLKRFIVASESGKQKQEISVYGTRFNINAFPEAKEIVTTLVEGRIQLHNIHTAERLFLQPMQQLSLSGPSMTIVDADLSVNLAWMKNMFYFSNLDCREAFQQIGRWYGVDFVYPKDISPVRIFAQISRDRNLTEVLEILERSNDLHFAQIGKEVIVTH